MNSRFLFAIVASLLFISCGGGGGATTESPPANTENTPTENIPNLMAGEWKRLTHNGIEELADVIMTILEGKMEWVNPTGCTWDTTWSVDNGRYHWEATVVKDNSTCDFLVVGATDDGVITITSDGSRLTLDSDDDERWGTDVFQRQ